MNSTLTPYFSQKPSFSAMKGWMWSYPGAPATSFTTCGSWAEAASGDRVRSRAIRRAMRFIECLLSGVPARDGIIGGDFGADGASYNTAVGTLQTTGWYHHPPQRRIAVDTVLKEFFIIAAATENK